MNTQVAGQVLVLFILMAMGFVSFKLKITTKEASAYFSSFVMKISLPCLILYSFRRPFSRELLGEALTALAASTAIYVVSFLIAWVYPYILKIKGRERGIHRYAVVVSNSGFIGYPVVQALLGPFYLFHASLFNIPVNVLGFSIGAWLVAKEKNRAAALSWKNFVSPALAATAVGFVMFLFSVPLPEPLERSIRLAGDITTPVSMAVIGISLAQADMKQVFGSWRIYITVFMRLLVVPALAALLCFLAGIRGPHLILPVLLTAMPAGSSTSIFASVYDVAPEEAGAIVALSTMLSAATIPLTVAALHFFAG